MESENQEDSFSIGKPDKHNPCDITIDYPIGMIKSDGLHCRISHNFGKWYIEDPSSVEDGSPKAYLNRPIVEICKPSYMKGYSTDPVIVKSSHRITFARSAI